MESNKKCFRSEGQLRRTEIKCVAIFKTTEDLLCVVSWVKSQFTYPDIPDFTSVLHVAFRMEIENDRKEIS